MLFGTGTLFTRQRYCSGCRVHISIIVKFTFERVLLVRASSKRSNFFTSVAFMMMVDG
jgi:hypothetical protein